MLGKVPPDALRELVLSRTGAPDDRVLQGPAYGEDTAAVSLGEETLVVNTDPLSLAVERVGTLAVNVACNDVAASGGVPAWLTCAVFLPGDADPLDEITRQLDETARELDVAIVGGHSEFLPALSTPLLVVTCLGLADRYVPTGGARPGDRLVLAGSAGIEATAIIATDFREQVAETVGAETLAAGEACFDDVSVVLAGRTLAPYASAMHDPTEGGLVDGLFEMAAAAGVELDVDRDAVPVRGATAKLCAAVGVDPLRTFGSGALVAAVPDEDTAAALSALDEAGVEANVVGTVRAADSPRVRLDGETVTEPGRDQMYALWE
ncbi:AIR synthase family protein [Halorarius halobius]|uniref:AIR synthase family protein n=1 Tax=Halorarius halobius TaxID=2962671 RepID=UPI0020CBF971|nr:AIR synthase family protein [Halorarius halobius]